MKFLSALKTKFLLTVICVMSVAWYVSAVDGSQTGGSPFYTCAAKCGNVYICVGAPPFCKSLAGKTGCEKTGDPANDCDRG